MSFPEPPATPGSAAGGWAAARPGLLSGRPWRPRPLPAPEHLERLRRSLPLDGPASTRLLAILAGRGFHEASELEAFFFPALAQLPDPALLEEMDAAVDRLLAAAARGERVAVHGDFDVDGLTGAALLHDLLGALVHEGAGPQPWPVFVPDRLRDGYGVAGRMIRRWADEGVDLLLTVDTGAAAHEELAEARQRGLDVIVLDHHVFTERPPVVALVNPRRPGSRYPNPDLCGVAVAFKLVQALRRAAPGCLPHGFEESVLDLVALGLVADQMPLLGENRGLVRKGLERMDDRRGLRPGLTALLAVTGLDSGFPLTAGDLAYQVAPRLNACGRIGRVGTALELLLTDDPLRAGELAAEADRTNRERRDVDQRLTEEAVTMAVPYLERGDPGLVLASPAWHKGIIGIGASRLVEQYRVPTILIAVEGDEARGSARSTPAVDIKEALDRCSGLLLRHGGHAQAAGLALHAGDVDRFREAFCGVLAALPAGGPVPQDYDLELPLQQLTSQEVSELLAELDQLEPFGMGHRRPVFCCRGVRLLRPPTMLGNGAHLRFAFRGPADPPPGGSPALAREFVAFGSGDAWRRWLSGGRDPQGQEWDILFELSRSTFRPRHGVYDPVQQQLVDLRPAGGP